MSTPLLIKSQGIVTSPFLIINWCYIYITTILHDFLIICKGDGLGGYTSISLIMYIAYACFCLLMKFSSLCINNCPPKERKQKRAWDLCLFTKTHIDLMDMIRLQHNIFFT